MRELGDQLRAAGLTARALAAWAGTDRIAALDTRLPALAAREPVPAAAALALFVAGVRLAPALARGLPIDRLIAAGLVEPDPPGVRARVAIVPLGSSFVVCDRRDAPMTADRVAWPDDSSHHLASAIPAGRVERWLDLGTGSAFAPLARPHAAAQITGVELNPRGAAHARLGAALSGVGHLAIEDGDLAIAQPPADLVTCNAPLPMAGVERWRYAGGGFFERLWVTIPARVAPGGLAIVHAALSAIPHDTLPGERVVVAYTPVDVTPGFGVLWWRPDAPDRLAVTRRALTPDRPHLDARDRS